MFTHLVREIPSYANTSGPMILKIQFLLTTDPHRVLYTHIYNLFMWQGYVYICFFTLFGYFMPKKSSRINTKSQLFKHFSDLFWAAYRFLCNPQLNTRVAMMCPPLLYSSLSRRFVIPLALRCQHCGRSHSPNLPIYPPFAKVQTHSAQTLSGFRQHHFFLTRGGGTGAAN